MKKKTVLITGATSGIGRALSDFYNKKNYQLILTGSSSAKIKNLKKVFPLTSFIKQVDLTNSNQLKKFIKECITKFKKIDILIVNAGIYEPSSVIKGNPDNWDRVVSLNLSSVFRIINLVLPFMKKNNFGDIAITSSISGHQDYLWEHFQV